LHVNGQYLRGFSQMRRRRGHESWERGAPVLPLSGPEIAPVSLSFSEIWELPRISSQFFGYCGTRTYDNSIFGSSRHARSIRRNQARNRTPAGSRLWREGGEYLKGIALGTPVAVEATGNWSWIVNEIE